MRILLFSHVSKDPNGGSSRVYHLLDEGFTARGHIVRALHYQDLALHGMGEKFINRLLLPQAASRRIEQEHPEQYDVVMSSSGMLYPLFRRLRNKRHRPLLVSH
jgi:hypothetical protein